VFAHFGYAGANFASERLEKSFTLHLLILLFIEDYCITSHIATQVNI